MHQLLINEAPLQVLPSLACAVGLNEALILQQIHYWLSPKHNQNVIENRHWVFNSYEQWQTQFPFWCTKTICRTIVNLENVGLLATFVGNNNFRRVKHYTINYDALAKVQGLSKVPEMAQTEDEVVSTVEEEEVEKEDEEEDIQEMLVVWNDTVQSHFVPYQPAILTPKRILGFTNLHTAFAKQGISWRSYCKKIAGTRFLMGENTKGFKVTLDWALNLDNACKVLEGAIYDKPASTTDRPILNNDGWATLVEEIKAFLPVNSYTQGWLHTCQHLVANIGASTFRSWFLRRVSLISINGDTVILQVESNFYRDWLYNHYHDQIKAALRLVYPAITNIKFQVSSCAR